MNKPHIQQKEAMIKALEHTLGVVSPACKSVGISRSTHYNWLENDPDYKAEVEDLPEAQLDFAEHNLHKQIQKGSVSATIFLLKTKGKHRGYVEQIDYTSGGEAIHGAGSTPIHIYTQGEMPVVLDGQENGEKKNGHPPKESD